MDILNTYHACLGEIDLQPGRVEFQYGSVDYSHFAQHHKAGCGEIAVRKIIALPLSLWSGIVKVLYHLAQAVFVGLVKLCMGDRAYIKAKFFSIARDFQEAFGRFISLFHDTFGQYHVEESYIQKELYCKVLKRADLLVEPAEENGDPSSPFTQISAPLEIFEEYSGDLPQGSSNDTSKETSTNNPSTTNDDTQEPPKEPGLEPIDGQQIATGQEVESIKMAPSQPERTPLYEYSEEEWNQLWNDAPLNSSRDGEIDLHQSGADQRSVWIQGCSGEEVQKALLERGRYEILPFLSNAQLEGLQVESLDPSRLLEIKKSQTDWFLAIPIEVALKLQFKMEKYDDHLVDLYAKDAHRDVMNLPDEQIFPYFFRFAKNTDQLNEKSVERFGPHVKKFLEMMADSALNKDRVDHLSSQQRLSLINRFIKYNYDVMELPCRLIVEYFSKESEEGEAERDFDLEKIAALELAKRNDVISRFQNANYPILKLPESYLIDYFSRLVHQKRGTRAPEQERLASLNEDDLVALKKIFAKNQVKCEL